MLLAAACASSEPGWKVRAELPTPRTEVAVAALDKIYVAGGFTGDGSGSDVVEAYDPASDSWKRSVPLPEPLHHAAMVAAGGRLFVAGGYKADGAPSAGVWTWAPGDDVWRSGPDLPTPRGALALAAYQMDGGTRIHAVGGATRFGGPAGVAAAHEVYDPAARRWSSLPSLPAPRDHLAAAALDEDIYVVGGRELSLERNRARLDVCDTSTRRWLRAADMPTARGGIAAASLNGRLFVFGGEERSGTFEEAEVYDPGEEQWSSVDALPTPRHGLGAAVLGDRVYVIGGGTTPGLSVSGANEVLAIET